MANQQLKVSLRGCLMIMAGALFCLFQVFLQASPAFMVNELMTDLVLTRGQIGVLASSLLYAYVLMQLPAGWLVDRYGVRFSFLAGITFLGLGSFVVSQATTFDMAIFGRLLTGIGSSTAIVGSFCMVTARFPRHWFAVGVGFIEMSSMLGGALCGAMTPGLVDSIGWRDTMLLFAVLSTVLFTITFLFVRDEPAEVTASKPVEQQDVKGDFRQILTSRNFVLSALFGLGIYGLVSAFGMMWGVPYLQCLYPEHHEFASRGISLLFVGLALGTGLSGWIVSLWGSYRHCMISGAVTTLLLLLVIMYQPVTVLMMAILLFVFGLTLGCYGLAFVSSKSSLGSSGLAMAMACINVFMLVSGQVLQPLLGHILDHRDVHTISLTLADYQAAFIPLVAMAGLALLSSVFLRESKECMR